MALSILSKSLFSSLLEEDALFSLAFPFQYEYYSKLLSLKEEGGKLCAGKVFERGLSEGKKG